MRVCNKQVNVKISDILEQNGASPRKIVTTFAEIQKTISMSDNRPTGSEAGYPANILNHLIAAQAERYGDRAALSAPDENNEWHDISWRRFAADVDTAAAALASIGVEEAENVATFSANRPENLVTDFACYRNRAVSVSIYATSSLEQVAYIVNDAKCRVIFAGNTTQYHIAREAQALQIAQAHCGHQAHSPRQRRLHLHALERLHEARRRGGK